MKKTTFFLIVLLSLLSSDCWAQVKREQKVEEDGFVWYKLRKWDGHNNILYNGAESASGKTLVPMGDYVISYQKAYGGCFIVFRDLETGPYSAYTKDGTCLIPLSKGYEDVFYNGNGRCEVTLNGKEGVYDAISKKFIIPLNKYDGVGYHDSYYIVAINDEYGVCDLTGKEVIPCRYHDISYSDSEGFYYRDSDGRPINFGVKLDASGRAYGSGMTSSSSSSSGSASSSSSSSWQQEKELAMNKWRPKAHTLYQDGFYRVFCDPLQIGGLRGFLTITTFLHNSSMAAPGLILNLVSIDDDELSRFQKQISTELKNESLSITLTNGEVLSSQAAILSKFGAGVDVEIGFMKIKSNKRSLSGTVADVRYVAEQLMRNNIKSISFHGCTVELASYVDTKGQITYGLYTVANMGTSKSWLPK